MGLDDDIAASKFLSYVLRHSPDALGLALERGGWAAVSELLSATRDSNFPFTAQRLRHMVATSDKQRFELSPDGTRIRARQGHSVAVELELDPLDPPPRLYHGTVARSLPAIRQHGLQRMARHHVHLSADIVTADRVGQRRGRTVLLIVRAAEMADAGHNFFLTGNGVWLTDYVAPEFLDFPKE